jgi:S1-C subfamily serine protease
MQPKSDKIVITESELPAGAPLRIHLPRMEPQPASQPAEPQHQPSQSARAGGGKLPLWIALAGLLVLLLAGSSVWFIQSREAAGWIERIGESADRSVVRVATGDRFGTGFVIASRAGRHLLLTNGHVVGDQPSVTLVLRSGRTVRGQVVGYPRDPEVDLALIEATAPELRPLGRLARFENLHSGVEVIAIGHPLGLDYTITEGIISAKRGGLYLQTSAAISPGNSGGPLVAANGQVVGVNTMTVKPEHGESLAFAIRADYVLDKTLWQFSQDVDDLLARTSP